MNVNPRLLEAVAGAKSVAVITGAGMSRESGIPTFRGEDGLWNNYRAEDLATPEAFHKDPLLVWQWYDWRRQIVCNAKPHAGHFAIADMETCFTEFLLITQNVDGLHIQAGSRKLIEIHGSIRRARCTRCEWRGELPDVGLESLPLHCKKCDALARPDVLWFGESYDEGLLSRAAEFLHASDLVWIVGSSGMVSVPVFLADIAARSGATLVDVNPEEAAFSHLCDITVRGTAGKDLPRIWNTVRPSTGV